MMIIVLLLGLVLLAALWFLFTSTAESRWIDITIQDGIGPMASLSFGGSSQLALLDTGSVYLMTSFAAGDCRTEYPSGTQEYYYAGPSAEFQWMCAEPTIGGLDLGPVPVGSVTKPGSQKALGLPAVIGLGALPNWASQRFKMESLLNRINIHEFWFSGSRLHLGALKHKGTPDTHVPIIPPISLPTPGLGYLTTDIQKLEVQTPSGSYAIERQAASSTLAQSSSFVYTIGTGTPVSMQMTEWFCLFDTGTFPAVFYADATANLLGPRVAQSMIPGQTQPSDFAIGSATFHFSDGSITASGVSVPILSPSTLQSAPTLMVVCGYSIQAKYDVRYQSCEKSGLPKSVDFFT